MAKRGRPAAADSGSDGAKRTPAEEKEHRIGIVRGRMDRALTALAALEKTVGYEELDDAKRKAMGETLSSHVSRVLTSIQHGKRGKQSTFQF